MSPRPCLRTDSHSRSFLAQERAQQAREALSCCDLCAHHCRVNRSAGERGLCRAGAEARIFSAQIEVSDELVLAPVFAIAFSGCDLRCDFCITGAESWNPRAGALISASAAAARSRDALSEGARTIMILGGEPTIHLPAVLELVSELPETATLIWKTNAHGSPKARQLLDGIFDIWVADAKFGNDVCARRLARVHDYLRVLQDNLLWAAGRADLIVRHLLMPGHVRCCWEPIAAWLAKALPETEVNLRAGFWPAWRAHRHPELLTPALETEVQEAWRIAANYGLRMIH